MENKAQLAWRTPWQYPRNLPARMPYGVAPHTRHKESHRNIHYSAACFSRTSEAPQHLAGEEQEDKPVTPKGLQSAVQISVHSGLLDQENILLSDKTKQVREYYVQ